MKKLDYDAITNKAVIVDLTDEEILQYEKDVAFYKKAQKDAETQAKAKATAKSTLLDKLGITEDEAKLLLS